MASPLFPFCRRQPAAALSRAALKACDALVLEHLPLAVAERFREAVAIASATVRRLFPLVEREDLIQVARVALVRSAPRCRAGEPAEPFRRRCIQGALQHHLRNRMRLVRVPRRLHKQGQCPLGHISLDASVDGVACLLDQLAAPEAEPASSEAIDGMALEQLVDQLPAAQATALRLTILEGLSLRQAPLGSVPSLRRSRRRLPWPLSRSVLMPSCCCSITPPPEAAPGGCCCGPS
jgi:RNA polymerase sigma-B factor